MPLKPVFSRHKRDGVQITDEPTGALDYAASKEILKLIEDINKRYGNTVLMVTHNNAIQYMADRVVRLRDGMVRINECNTQKIPAGQLEGKRNGRFP